MKCFLVFFLVLFQNIASAQSLNLMAWRTDTLGCQKQRQMILINHNFTPTLDSLLLNKSCEEVIELLGSPDCQFDEYGGTNIVYGIDGFRFLDVLNSFNNTCEKVKFLSVLVIKFYGKESQWFIAYRD